MIRHRKVLALITARGGSKGIPGKNIIPLAGKPLIAWTIQAALASKYIDRLVLSTDDITIANAAHEAGCEVPFTRPATLATDEASSIDVVMDALDRLEGYDIVILLQPTSPLRTNVDIDGCIESMETAQAPACVSVRPADEHPFLTFKLGPLGTMCSYAEPPPGQSLRRQDLPLAWCLNGAVYAAQVEWLREHRSFLSNLTIGYPMPAERSIDIDTPADLLKAAELLRP